MPARPGLSEGGENVQLPAIGHYIFSILNFKFPSVMSDDKPLVNRVAASSLITIKLEEYFPQEELVDLDLKEYLFKGLMLREKEFREAMKEHDWEQYQDKVLLVYCSTDAIVPVWAYMLVASYAAPYVADLFQGDRESFYRLAFRRILDNIDPKAYEDERIVIKGCSDKPIPLTAYMELTAKLRPYARSIMFGEPCSTVPIYKKPRSFKGPKK
jgi:hypothetical protein